jgi:hypothetical protein
MASTPAGASGGKPLPDWYYAICPPEASIVLTQSLEQWALQTAEGKDEVLKGKDEVLKGKDEALKAKDVALKVALDALADKQKALEGAEQRHLQEICKYKLTYQIRETFTWLLRCLMVDKLDKSPCNLYQELFKVMTEEGKGPTHKLTADALQIYKQIQPHFKTGACNQTFIERLRGQFALVHERHHSSPKLLELPGRTGLACGGESLDTMFMHAFVVLNIQALCIKHEQPLPPELTTLAVMTAEYDRIVGDCINGIFVVPYPADRQTSGRRTSASGAHCTQHRRHRHIMIDSLSLRLRILIASHTQAWCPSYYPQSVCSGH